MPKNSSMRFAVGVVSSVAGEAVEAALIHSDGRDAIRPVGGVSIACDESLQWGLLEAAQNDLPTTEILRLERDLTHHYSRAVDELRGRYPEEMGRVQVVGLDGHSVRNLPDEGLSLQIGNPWLLAELTGLPVISDFRRFDLSIGGQGAPIDALYHWALMAKEPRPALMIDLSSVTSLTWLSEANEIIAGDVGPGVELLDEWVQEVAEASDDRDGAVSTLGVVDEVSVRAALRSPFFSRPLPRTPTRSDFEAIDVSGHSPHDGAATICGVIADAVLAAVEQLPARPSLVWVTGPGSRHPLILNRLRAAFDDLRNVEQRGLSPDTMQAECFGWLAIRYQRGLPISTPETTGCRQAMCAGLSTRWNNIDRRRPNAQTSD